MWLCLLQWKTTRTISLSPCRLSNTRPQRPTVITLTNTIGEQFILKAIKKKIQIQKLFLPVFFPHVCFNVQFLTQIQLMNQSIKCAQNWTQMNPMEDDFSLINLAIFNIKFIGIYKYFSLLEDFDFHLEVKLPKLLLPLPVASTGRNKDDNNNMEVIFLNYLVVYKTIQLQTKVKESLELSRNLHEFIIFLRQIAHVECQNQSPPLLPPPPPPPPELRWESPIHH